MFLKLVLFYPRLMWVFVLCVLNYIDKKLVGFLLLAFSCFSADISVTSSPLKIVLLALGYCFYVGRIKVVLGLTLLLFGKIGAFCLMLLSFSELVYRRLKLRRYCASLVLASSRVTDYSLKRAYLVYRKNGFL